MVADVLQLSGLAVVCFGLGLIYAPIGVLAFGAALFYVGLQIERRN